MRTRTNKHDTITRMSQEELQKEIHNAPPFTTRKDRWGAIAKALVYDSARIQAGQHVLLWYEQPTLPLMKLIQDECTALNTTLSYYKRDLEKDAKIVPTLSASEMTDYLKEEYRLVRETDTSIIVRAPENPEALDKLPSDKRKQFALAYKKVHEPRINGSRGWTLFYYPTYYEAKKESMHYNKYVETVLAACEQPWNQIHACQQKLVDMLNTAKTLRLVANPNDPDPNRRTDVSMSIESMTFVNSTVDQNYPGSEVFSAPVKESVNGHIFAQGAYLYSGHLMRDLTFDITDGKIHKAHAAENDRGLQEILSNGEGARYFGEVALGTNPGLTRRFFNALLNEKVGGSFHMAVGHCYTFTEDLGVNVNVNNGNTSKFTPNHWDITISMRPEMGGGAVYVDGEMIQKDGTFLDPDLALLNGS